MATRRLEEKKRLFDQSMAESSAATRELLAMTNRLVHELGKQLIDNMKKQQQIRQKMLEVGALGLKVSGKPGRVITKHLLAHDHAKTDLERERALDRAIKGARWDAAETKKLLGEIEKIIGKR
jgi:hypothetical protein